jgi:sugar lactone lactonase YvrE
MACTNNAARLPFLQSLVAIADGAVVQGSHGARSTNNSTAAAVLADPQRRLAVFGGREGLARSLASVYACTISLFLGGLRGVVVRRIATTGRNCISGLAVSRDGTTVFTANASDHAMRAYSVASGELLCATPGKDYATRPLQFLFPRQLCVAADDTVLVADGGHNCIHVVTPRFDTLQLLGKDDALQNPTAVCCDDELVAAIGGVGHLIVFCRVTGARRLYVDLAAGLKNLAKEHFACLSSMCFWTSRRDVAFSDFYGGCVFAVSLKGKFLQRIGDAVLRCPQGLACSAFDELLVADGALRRLFVFSTAGELMRTLDCDVTFGCIALHGSSVFAGDGGRSIVEIQ